MNIKNLHNLIKMSVPMLALVASSAFYTSCGKDDIPEPTPPPSPPVEKTDSLSYAVNASVQAINDIADAINTDLGNTKKYIKLIRINGNLKITPETFEVIKQIVAWKDKLGNRFEMPGFVCPGVHGWTLGTDQAKEIKNLNIGKDEDAGYRFWILPSMKDLFSADQLASMLVADSELVIENGKDFASVISTVVELAAKQNLSVVFGNSTNKEIHLDLEQLPLLRKLQLENISVSGAPGAKIVTRASMHPTPAYYINSMNGINVPMDLVMVENARAPGKINAICMNDTIPNLLKTLCTQDKATGHVRTVDSKGALTDPVFGTFGIDQKTVSVDGIPAHPIDITSADAGVYGNENGGYYMLVNSLKRATEGESRNIFPHFAERTITLNFTKDPKYREHHSIVIAEYDCINLDFKSLDAPLRTDDKNTMPAVYRVFGLPQQNIKVRFNSETFALVVKKGTDEAGELYQAQSIEDLPRYAMAALERRAFVLNSIDAIPRMYDQVKNEVFSLNK